MKKRTYSEPQKAYILAKANLEAIKEEESTIEQNYIIEHGIANEDGSIPSCSWTIDDDETAEKAIEECCKLIEKCGLDAKKQEAEKILRAAEDALVQYGLDTMPRAYAKEKAILERESKTNYTIRRKLIDLTVSLDVSTLPAIYRGN